MIEILQINISKAESRKVKYSLNFEKEPLLFDSKKEYNKFKEEYEHIMRYKQRGLNAHYTIRYNTPI